MDTLPIITEDQILSLKAGRQLDELIELYVMGNKGFSLPCYSTSIEEAWKVMSHFDGICITKYKAGFTVSLDAPYCLEFVCECKTAPEAICKAALILRATSQA